jgi:hypothetical protein
VNATRTILATLAIGTLSAGYAAAQTYAPLPGDNVQAYHHASTVQEGWQRGRADLIRAQGQYNYNTALANVVAQQARAASIENDLRAAEAYHEKKEQWEYNRIRNARPRLTAEQHARINKSRAPKRLDPTQFDAVLGVIYWPETLERPEFEACRAEMDELFASRVPGSAGQGTENCREIEQVAARMRKVLKAEINAIPSQEWMEAKKFVDGLAFEARFDVLPEGLAQN